MNGVETYSGSTKDDLRILLLKNVMLASEYFAIGNEDWEEEDCKEECPRDARIDTRSRWRLAGRSPVVWQRCW